MNLVPAVLAAYKLGLDDSSNSQLGVFVDILSELLRKLKTFGNLGTLGNKNVKPA